MHWIGGFLLLVFVGNWGCQEVRLARVAQSEPQTLTCEALGRDGPGNNAWVTMTNHVLLTHSFVYLSRKQRISGKEKWTEAWVPAVPRDGEYHRLLHKAAVQYGEAGETGRDFVAPAPTDLQVIVKITSLDGQEDVDRLAEAATLRGMIVNQIDRLSSETRRILAQSYPGIDLDRCWILQVRRSPTNPIVGNIAILLSVAGSIWLFVRWRVSRATRPAAATEPPARRRSSSEPESGRTPARPSRRRRGGW